ncbi:MAG: hypothetical protein RIQ34_1270, partial [Bacteroidota bacterium]
MWRPEKPDEAPARNHIEGRGLESVLDSAWTIRDWYARHFCSHLSILLSVLLGFMVLLADSKFFPATANLGYALGILFLLLVFPFHSRIKGTESIIRIGAFNFQPAEFVKIFAALSLAKFLSRPELDFRHTGSQIRAALIVLFPALLCILQSETGLALVYTSFFLVMYREGLPASIPVMAMA